MIFDSQQTTDKVAFEREQRLLAGSAEHSNFNEVNGQLTINDKEMSLIQKLAEFPTVVKDAGVTYTPSVIANYVYDLVKEFNQFYHDYSILREEDEAVKRFRLVLSANVAKIIRLGMGLLGIEVPDRM